MSTLLADDLFIRFLLLLWYFKGCLFGNAFAPIDFAFSFVVLIVTVLIALQPLNADLPIFAILLPIVTVFNFLQF